MTGHDIAEWMAAHRDRSAWYVALDDTESVVGFQWISPHDKLPDDAAVTVVVAKDSQVVNMHTFAAETINIAAVMNDVWRILR